MTILSTFCDMPNKFNLDTKKSPQLSSSTDQWTANDATWRYYTTFMIFRLNCSSHWCFIDRLKRPERSALIDSRFELWVEGSRPRISVGLRRQTSQNKPLEWDLGTLKKTCKVTRVFDWQFTARSNSPLSSSSNTYASCALFSRAIVMRVSGTILPRSSLCLLVSFITAWIWYQ